MSDIDEMVRNAMKDFSVSGVFTATGCCQKNLRRDLQRQIFGERRRNPYFGEPDTEDLLYEITGEKDRRKEAMLKARKVTIEAADGKEYSGEVKRVEMSPCSGMTVEVHVDTKEVGNYGIKNVIFANPSTIVYWTDGTKTVVTCQDNIQFVKMKKKKVCGKIARRMVPMPAETYSKEIGLAMCFAKKMLGNKGNYNNIFRQFIEGEVPEKEEV